MEEAMLIAAFHKRQEIEASKVIAIITALTNPTKAADACLKFLKNLMPEYDMMREEKDALMKNALSEDMGMVFELGSSDGGWVATKKSLKE